LPFVYHDLATGEELKTDEPLVFWMYLREKAARDIQAWHDSRVKALTQRIATAKIKDDREYIESSMRLEPGSVDGKNAEERKAQLEVLLRGDTHWLQAVQYQQDGELLQGQHEAASDAAYARLRVTLRDLDVMAALYSPQETDREIHE